MFINVDISYEEYHTSGVKLPNDRPTFIYRCTATEESLSETGSYLIVCYKHRREPEVLTAIQEVAGIPQIGLI